MFPVFSSLQQLKYPRKLAKANLNKIVIRGTKDRPPHGSLKRVVTPVQKRASLTVRLIDSPLEGVIEIGSYLRNMSVFSQKGKVIK